MKNAKQNRKTGGLVGEVCRRLFRRLTARYSDPLWWLSRVCGEEASVVQIGSNDGGQEDPVSLLLVRHPGWQAVLVEPVPYLFERLRKRYEGRPGCRLLNVAVNDGSEADFFWVGPQARQTHPDFPEWVEQLGSFNRSHILSHLDGSLEPYIESVRIRGVRLMELFEQCGLREIDLLHTDCEGCDWDAVSQLDFEAVLPRAILFEHKHLAACDREAACAFLRPHYRLFDLGSDLLGIEAQIWSKVFSRSQLWEPLFWMRLLPLPFRKKVLAHCAPGAPL